MPELHSPVSYLPPEVLSHVFLFYVAHLEEHLSDITLPAQGPFCLAQVCSRWRAIVISDPRLWSFIHLALTDSFINYTKGVERFTLVFDLYLKRSGTLSLSLTCTYHWEYNSFVGLLFDRLWTHSHRWRSISLNFTRGDFHPKLTSCDLRSLEHLSVRGADLKLRMNLKSATNLKSFAYCGPQDPKGINLRWDQLEEVSFECWLGHLECLARCRNITTLSLCARAGYFNQHTDWKRVTLFCLRTLRVQLSTREPEVHRAIDLLVLPQLQTLEISPEPKAVRPRTLTEERWDVATLLIRSGCSLRHLSIQDVNLTGDQVLRCLKHSGSLLSFRYIPDLLSQHDLGDVVCKLRVLPLDQMPTEDGGRTHGPLVPELRDITLGTSVYAYLDTILAICRSRGGSHAHAAGVAALQRVGVLVLDTSLQQPSCWNGQWRAACLYMELKEWVAEMENEGNKGGGVLGEKLEASVEAFFVYELGVRLYIDSYRLRSGII